MRIHSLYRAFIYRLYDFRVIRLGVNFLENIFGTAEYSVERRRRNRTYYIFVLSLLALFFTIACVVSYHSVQWSVSLMLDCTFYGVITFVPYFWFPISQVILRSRDLERYAFPILMFRIVYCLISTIIVCLFIGEFVFLRFMTVLAIGRCLWTICIYINFARNDNNS